MNLKKIIQEEINNFGWISEINPTLFEYFENGLLEVGDVVTVRGETLNNDGNLVFLDEAKYQIVKLSNLYSKLNDHAKFLSSSVEFDIETQKKLDVYNQTDLIEEDMGLEVLDHQRNGTMDMGDNVLREDDGDGLDWIRNTNPVTADDFINKAFYFDPTAEEGDEDYTKLVDKLNDLGFSPVYGTTSFVGEGEYIAGLFSYLDFDRNPKYVFTRDDVDTRTWDDYKQHIQGFALGESEARDDLEVVDARAFITQFT